jgi:hypothetical protein
MHCLAVNNRAVTNCCMHSYDFPYFSIIYFKRRVCEGQEFSLATYNLAELYYSLGSMESYKGITMSYNYILTHNYFNFSLIARLTVLQKCNEYIVTHYQ